MSLIQCPECAREISDRAYSCPHCGYIVPKVPPLAVPEPDPAPDAKRTGFEYGVWGFVLALFSLFLPVAYLDLLLAIVAFILSMIAITRKGRRKGLAIAGVVISIVSAIGALTLLAVGPWVYLF